MISIIICSVNTALLEQLKTNIKGTIGVPFEIIAINNGIKKKSIAAIYNQGAALAKFGVLCFIHEDVIIHSSEWGKSLIDLLADETIGLVGVSGAVYKSNYAGTWSACNNNLYRTHSIQHFESALQPVTVNTKQGNEVCTEVAVIDGVFMATTKNIVAKHPFDEQLLNGFHGYDTDYSLQVGSEYKIVVTYSILLEHFSPGKLNQDWLRASLSVQRKWKKELPKSVIDVDKRSKLLSDYLSNQCVLNVALLDKSNRALVASTYLKLIVKYFSLNKFKYTRQVALFFWK